MINYLIIAGIALVSSVILFFTLKDHKKIRIGVIAFILLATCTYIGLHFYLQKPIIWIQGDRNISLEVFDTYIEKGATAQHRFKDITDEIVIEGTVDTDIVGGIFNGVVI